jgi:hypothetical protein
MFRRRSDGLPERSAVAPPEPSKLLLLGFLCLLGLLRCLLLRFLSHSILFWVNGWKRDSEACSGRASLATASIVIRTDSRGGFARRHRAVIRLSTAVMRFEAFSSLEMTARRKSRSSCPALCRASTSCFCDAPRRGWPGQAGHDGVLASASRLTIRQSGKFAATFINSKPHRGLRRSR